MLNDAPKPKGHLMPAGTMLFASRLGEVTFECLPQILIQLVAIVRTSAVVGVSWFQCASVLCSLLSAGFVLALAHFDVDTTIHGPCASHGWSSTSISRTPMARSSAPRILEPEL